MNRRGFLGLLSKLVTVGAAIGVAPQVLAPLETMVKPAFVPQVTLTEAFAFMTTKPTWSLAA